MPAEAPPIPIAARRLGSFLARLRGLLGRPPPPPGEAVWLVPCRQVHSFGMRYAIDVIYLDRQLGVVAVESLPANRLGRFVWRADSVLEMRQGEAGRLGLKPGSRLQVSPITA
jgi:uncharacterized protein